MKQAVSTADDTNPVGLARFARGLLIVSAIALILHGLIELGSLAVAINPGQPLQQFAFKELNTQPVALAGIGVAVGTLRLLAAGGILTNRLWGWVLGLLLSVATFSMLTLYLPAGMFDAVLSGVVMAGLVIARFGKQKILE